MSSTTVAEFAHELKKSADVLLDQLRSAGVAKTSDSDTLNDADKQKLLSYLQASHGPALVECIERCRTGLEQHRRNNFTGAMLRHHQHKSTQYMAQWIEAKNRPHTL